MNEKDRLLKMIEESNADTSIKNLAKTCIESAYSAGFQKGMKCGSEIYSRTLEMLSPFKRKASNGN
jgi:hypothetical protein